MKWRRKVNAMTVFTGNCFVRQHTADGHFVGRCYHSTYNDMCPLHGNVAEWLCQEWGDWPRDYELEDVR